MKALIQRVSKANVKVESSIAGEIDHGLLVFLGVTDNDTSEEVDFLVNKIVNLRIFNDNNDKMNLSLLDVKGEMLVVSQFTLYADCQRGRRPSYTQAAAPDYADKMYEEFISKINELGIEVKSGVFGAHMEVSLINDGPVTIMIEK
jgi:D-tyrosyl-tRNA(Tyr) deacylase